MDPLYASIIRLERYKPSPPSRVDTPFVNRQSLISSGIPGPSSQISTRSIDPSIQVDFTPQTFSRRYSSIKEECFNGYRTHFDPTIFDVYNTVIITGNASKNYLNKLAARLNSNPIPFESTLRVSGKEMFWYVRLQASHLSKLLSRMSTDLEHLSVYLLDYSESRRYAMEPEAYEEDQHRWNKDEQYMIHDVLKSKK